MTVAERIIVYKETPGGELRMHVFEAEASGANRPAIVFFHGGGWTGGVPAQFFEQCRYLASRGMVAASAEYRLVGGKGESVADCVMDGKSAVRWMRAHADELGVDPAHIAAGGGSAGGHVAACTGTIDGLDGAREDLGVSSKPDALVLFNPALDMTQHERHLADSDGPPEAVSPLHHVKPGAPPTIILHGADDTTVPLDEAERFAAAMTDAGNTCRLVPYAGQPHGFFNYRDGNNPYYTRTLAEVDRFFIGLGWLAGEPTITVR